MKTVQEIFNGSDGEATKGLYERLSALGTQGVVAVNLFRAVKCSTRAKQYSRRFKGDAYGRKNWSLGNLVAGLGRAGAAAPPSEANRQVRPTLPWGWKEDPEQEFHRWVLYVELPTGQVSFHAAARLAGPDYAGEWDGVQASAERIVRWCAGLLGEATVPERGRAGESEQGRSVVTPALLLPLAPAPVQQPLFA